MRFFPFKVDDRSEESQTDRAAGGSISHASLGIRLLRFVGLHLVIVLLANIVSMYESISSSSP